MRGRAGERCISPAVQRQQIEGWVRLRGARLGEVLDELDESGTPADRPLHLRPAATTAVLPGKSAVIRATVPETIQQI